MMHMIKTVTEDTKQGFLRQRTPHHQPRLRAAQSCGKATSLRKHAEGAMAGFGTWQNRSQEQHVRSWPKLTFEKGGWNLLHTWWLVADVLCGS
jgi:hypothetical protein